MPNSSPTAIDLGNIFFTSGGTEADNMAIKCGIKDHNITHAITSKLSHHAVLHPLEELEKSGVIKLSDIKPVFPRGHGLLISVISEARFEPVTRR